MQFRHQIKRGLQKTPCCKHRIKTARQRDDDVIDKAHHQMYASTASITHNNGIQLSLEQALAPGSSSGSTSSTGTASSGDQPLTNGKVGTAVNNGQLNNAFYLNNLRNHQPPPPYVNNQLTVSPIPGVRGFPPGTPTAFAGQPAASLPASVRATPTADFELYPRHLRTHSYTQATQPPALNQQIYNPVQSTPSYRRNPQPPIQQYPLRQLNSPNHISQQQLSSPNILSDQRLYDKIHGRQSSSSAGS